MKKYLLLFVPMFVLNLGLFSSAKGLEKSTGKQDLKFKVEALTSKGSVEYQITEPADFKASKNPLDSDVISEFKQLKIVRVDRKHDQLPKKINRIAVIGDTGCRLKTSAKGGRYQDCRSEKAWPFKKIMGSLQKQNPDLVIHLGDYHYRESCGADKACLEKSNSLGYGWEAWRDDFFQPAGPLLEKVPWVFVRGNHEDCKRAHLGFDFFLGGEYHPENAKIEDCVDRMPTQFIHIGDILIVNMDSSPVGDAPGISEKLRSQINKDLDQLGVELADKAIQTVWLVTHKPYAGFAPFAKTALPVNINLRQVFEAHPSFKKIQLAMAGHVHLLEILSPIQGPTQLVVGNSGTDLDELVVQPDFKAMGYSWGFSTSKAEDFGYVILSRDTTASGWLLKAFDSNGIPLVNCELGQKAINCKKTATEL